MIYICTHKPKELVYHIEGEEYAVVNNNYSNLSEEYRHLRGMMAVYKSLDLPEEIGIYQHRRFMNILTIPDGYDMVVPTDPRTIEYNKISMKQQFINCHPLLYKNFEIIENILGEDFIKYINVVCSPSEQITHFFWHNIFIMRKNDFLNYCNFLFSTLQEYEKQKTILSTPTKFPAICFLAERIGSYWLYKYSGKKYLKEITQL